MDALWLLAGPALAAGGYGLLMSPASQVFGRYPYHGNRRERVVALTFDDGPNEPYTSEIADFLSTEGIRGTFFMVGRCVRRWPGSARRLYEAGHVVGNHSYRHEFGTYLRPGRFGQEIALTQEVLAGELGVQPALVRTPWLWRQPALLRGLRRASLQPVAGTFAHPAEVWQPHPRRMARWAVARTRPGSILIFHDGFDGRGGNRAETVRAVRLTVVGLRSHGYTFVTVDELLGVPAYRDVTPP